MKPLKIVVGVDFSPEAELAARQAVEIAGRAGGEVVLVHCGEVVELPELGDGAGQAERDAAAGYRSRLAALLAADREQLSSLAERLSGRGAIVSQAVREGVPDAALCRAADELAADLVVVGTHGRTGLRWFFLGSVAERLVRLCAEDVMVARGAGAGKGGFRRVLVATDFSPAAERALDRALELAAAGAHVDVVHHLGLRLPARHFGGPPVAPFVPPDNLELELTAFARERGVKLLASRRRPGVEISFYAQPGAPVPSIVHSLEGAAYDLVALGSHGRRGFRRFLLGSVAETVVRRAPCSVFIARAAADRAGERSR
jgi:nucleotide-binding universal stress UspA family protein